MSDIISNILYARLCGIIVALYNWIFYVEIYPCSNRFKKFLWVSIELPVICYSQPGQASLIYGDILELYYLETLKNQIQNIAEQYRYTLRTTGELRKKSKIRHVSTACVDDTGMTKNSSNIHGK